MGIIPSFISQSWPPKSKFHVEDIPDLSGRVVLVTGGNTGIGYQTAKGILSRNAKVYLACRDAEKGKKAIESLKAETGKEAIFLPLDLANLKSIKSSAEEFLGKETQLHILFNNAGVMVPPKDQLTADGYDLTVGVNCLGHFYLTKLLLPALLAVSQQSNGLQKSRVVNTSSFASEMGKTLDFAMFKDGPTRRKTSVETLYVQSKMGNVIFATEFAQRYAEQGIVSTSVNPGNLESDLQRHLGSFRQRILKMLILNPVEFGALTQLYAGTSVEGEGFNGKYLVPWARIYRAPPATQDKELGKALWEWLEEQVKDL
ncbi:hypothetical protein C8J56DRAFT_819676 [Mycena floridula]|nr:hypothetical protein C8J56DRAFT_819676 [Mycena floridula]